MASMSRGGWRKVPGTGHPTIASLILRKTWEQRWVKAYWKVGWKERISPGARLGPCGGCVGLDWAGSRPWGSGRWCPHNGSAGGLQWGGEAFLWCQQSSAEPQPWLWLREEPHPFPGPFSSLASFAFYPRWISSMKRQLFKKKTETGAGVTRQASASPVSSL